MCRFHRYTAAKTTLIEFTGESELKLNVQCFTTCISSLVWWKKEKKRIRISLHTGEGLYTQFQPYPCNSPSDQRDLGLIQTQWNPEVKWHRWGTISAPHVLLLDKYISDVPSMYGHMYVRIIQLKMSQNGHRRLVRPELWEYLMSHWGGWGCAFAGGQHTCGAE